MNTSLFRNTPALKVLDGRGLAIRDVDYYRDPENPARLEERITRHQFGANGFPSLSTDPRLHETGRANFTYITDLNGKVVKTTSVDAGITITLNDSAGRPSIVISNIGLLEDGTEDSSRAVTRTWLYEPADLRARPLAATEMSADGAARITERFVYAEGTASEQRMNLCGRCISHFDTAGKVSTTSIGLTGVPLCLERRLLKDADNSETSANWTGLDETAWNHLLDPEAYITLSTTDPTGEVLRTTDARGNGQRAAYDVSGLLSGCWLTVKGDIERTIVESLTYSAAGHKVSETRGNGVSTRYCYEPCSQRLIRIRTERAAGHPSGAKVLQDLQYVYDPVGNVLGVRNNIDTPRFWRNQRVVPESTYSYDSLYQLVSATGREMANAGQSGNHPPAVPCFDSATYTNYCQTYQYDRSGNLTQVRHSAAATNHNFTVDIIISHRSNRGVPRSMAETPAEVEALFTPGGQQKRLQPGQTLIWTPCCALHKVTPVVRDGAADDFELYRHDTANQRILKSSSQKTGGGTQTQRVLYLPGLEVRTTTRNGATTQSLQVIKVTGAGHTLARALHWNEGDTDGLLRFVHADLIGSCGLEVDADGKVSSMEEYYPYGATAILVARSQMEADCKTVRFSGKERDATGLYYYGHRYYQPWAGRWLSNDPAGAVDGLNLFRMSRNNPVTFKDRDGRMPFKFPDWLKITRSQMGIQPTRDQQEDRETSGPALQIPELAEDALQSGFADAGEHGASPGQPLHRQRERRTIKSSDYDFLARHYRDLGSMKTYKSPRDQVQPRASKEDTFFLGIDIGDPSRRVISHQALTVSSVVPQGDYMFVNRVDEPNSVRLISLDVPEVGHTSLTNNSTRMFGYEPEDVYFAGEISFDDEGRILYWSNDSGHYKPDGDNIKLTPWVSRLMPLHKFKQFSMF